MIKYFLVSNYEIILVTIIKNKYGGYGYDKSTEY